MAGEVFTYIGLQLPDSSPAPKKAGEVFMYTSPALDKCRNNYPAVSPEKYLYTPPEKYLYTSPAPDKCRNNYPAVSPEKYLYPPPEKYLYTSPAPEKPEKPEKPDKYLYTLTILVRLLSDFYSA